MFCYLDVGILCSRLCYIYHLWRCFTISIKELAINDQIKFKEVRVINTATGEQLGILPIEKALDAAYAKELDLVCFQPNAQPPVCKILDYGKYRFEQIKREKEAKKNQKVIEIKEIRIIGLGIDEHDINTKVKHIVRFLNDGCKVKVAIRFRGREMGHSDHGIELMNKIASKCDEYCTVEKKPKMEGRNMLMFLAPKSATKSGK
ncbi:MAG: translation initiation factor IF-3 [Clostridia bacterium]|nr:translation initiation factor IF-3 [Clostridia bacterium]